MKEPCFTSNYTRALRLAVKGDRRSLTDQLRAGVPLTSADMGMLAAFIEGRFRPKTTNPAHRPRMTFYDLRASPNPLHKAVIHYWREAEVLTRMGRAYGRLGPLNDELAAHYGVDPEALRSTRERHRKLNPHYRAANDRRKVG